MAPPARYYHRGRSYDDGDEDHSSLPSSSSSLRGGGGGRRGTSTSGRRTASRRSNRSADNEDEDDDRNSDFDDSNDSEDDASSGPYTSSSESDDDDDDEDGADNEDPIFRDSGSGVEAAALVTYQQMMQGQPILLGKNKSDGTCNVQLPSGKVIVVEASAFPEFDEDREASAAAEQEQQPPPSSSLRAQPRRQQRGANANARVPKATVRTTGRATTAEIEESIPNAASSVFHVFDRRVNLDRHGPNDTNYALLRSWVRDDPFRHSPDDAAVPPTSTTARRDRDREHPDHGNQEASDSGPAAAGKRRRQLPDRVDLVSELKRYEKDPTKMQDLRQAWVNNAKRIKRQKRQEFLERDAATAAGLERRLGVKM